MFLIKASKVWKTIWARLTWEFCPQFKRWYNGSWLRGKDSAYQWRWLRSCGLIPRSGSSTGIGNGNPLQYPCLENPMDGGAWWETVFRVAESRTHLSDWTRTQAQWQWDPGLEGLECICNLNLIAILLTPSLTALCVCSTVIIERFLSFLAFWGFP